MFPVYPTSAYISRLIALIAEFYPESPSQAKCKLFKNDFMPDPGANVASFTEADFTGYADVELLMTAPSLNDQGLVVSKSNVCNFSSSSGETQQVYGVYITNAAGTVLLAAQRFETPQTMGGALPQAVSGVWRTSEPLTTYGWINIED